MGRLLIWFLLCRIGRCFFLERENCPYLNLSYFDSFLCTFQNFLTVLYVCLFAFSVHAQAIRHKNYAWFSQETLRNWRQHIAIGLKWHLLFSNQSKLNQQLHISSQSNQSNFTYPINQLIDLYLLVCTSQLMQMSFPATLSQVFHPWNFLITAFRLEVNSYQCCNTFEIYCIY